ncbi:structural maintenance of chromosomes protein 6 [Neodiprion fabricii]|uniref:structural maintenance of chromosomes protein 6 n=1 Tax=Neodiprion fabricii TaxID=2872261 RepID=UPI001ED8CB21|nr:structural maintenance of chromosomes protein 6 [Neodiprion fabricii]
MSNERRKRKNSDRDAYPSKVARRSVSQANSSTDEDITETTGKIKRIFVRNFMCHDALEIYLNKNVNFIVGRNGSGKSALLTALVVGLGAKANTTSRGSSVKDFVKKGRNSAVIEITLCNEGPMAYKPEIYGDSILVRRTIGSAPGYKIKNSNGEVVSSKKDELERIIAEMSIQVDNPISILNQDVSRTFLVTAGPKEKYQLFMKATNLEKIGNNYKNAQIASEETRQRLIESIEHLSATKKEIDKLEKTVQQLESIEGDRAQREALNSELHWALAIAEERKLSQIQTRLEEQQNNVENHQEEIKTKEIKEKRIKAKINEFKEKIQEIKNEAAGSSEAYATAKQELVSNKEAHSVKHKELVLAQSKIKRMQQDINVLRTEIQRQEADSNQVENEKRRVREELSKLEEQLNEIDAMLLTKQTEQIHRNNNYNHLIQEERALKQQIDHNDTIIKKIKRQLNDLKQESDNAVTIFGHNMPRLLRRIKEEYDRGRFKQMPRGPLGAHVKVNDQTWAAAIENFLGFGTLRSFCADNMQDAKFLGQIMKEIFGNEHNPQISVSKFFHKMHDVSQHCTRAPGFKNLLEMMEISDPIVANCLIDQREVECILLIPTSQKASEMLSDRRKVPRNCKRAITLQGDEFFPDPNYKSYGGRHGMRAKCLQVSTKEAIQAFEEELVLAQEQRATILDEHKQIQRSIHQAKTDLNQVNSNISRLRSNQSKIKTKINELRDKSEIDESNSIAVFTTEMNELIQIVEKDSKIVVQLKKETVGLQKEVESSETEVKRCRDLMYCLDMKLEPIQKLIREQENELGLLSMNSQYGERRLLEAQQALQKLNADLEIQQRVTGKAVAGAAKLSARINTQRSAKTIKEKLEELRVTIETAERQFGTLDQITADLEEKKKKYEEVSEFASALKISNDEHLQRLEGRRRIYQQMKKEIGTKVRQSFQSILAVRQYKGSLTIDHQNRLLSLDVNPAGSAKRTTNDARSLSGGERSYSTVAFILALWECVKLPFYFLDEFDVFMDTVNRRTIMDILLDHTRNHPAHQFAFLTPLDTSSILAEDFVTIHQLAAPERAVNGEN